ncbi:hypothetical protein [Streptomyces sp. NPDC056883]|uniref:hypothetical protein n=1 Tax=Streptomyces sp. NPDC056883 TaxID=3345959 RepID=UPI003676DEFF
MDGYKVGQEEQSKLEARIVELKDVLNNATIEEPLSVVAVGTLVTLVAEGDEEETMYLLSDDITTGEVEVRSSTSPFRAAVLGRRLITAEWILHSTDATRTPAHPQPPLAPSAPWPRRVVLAAVRAITRADSPPR